ncbi:serine/threonine-protein kinase [Undibacterium sp. TJN25]|uniref:serine/threonine-protein kinase n=1 Tax=Undibacterium sp. TJN25 TaxID=3413056 RepID=UPI003BF109EB
MIDAEQLSKISSLLDVALTLEPEARAHFIEHLPEPDAQFREVLYKMLALSEQGTGTGMIDQLPQFDDLPDAEDLVEGEMIDGYRLLRELGHGGMGTVWLAERADGLIRRTVALKLPLVNMPHKMLLQRFERERSILAALSHPHIARLYDAGVSKAGQPYLVMEYVEGISINDYCDANRLTIPQRLQLFSQVLEAVQYAHANLIIHRDLKPANILVTGNGEVRLLDFGIAKLLETGEAAKDGGLADKADITGFAGSPLTLDYASPEQLMSEPVNIASDIYSLSILLYELLSGERPYHLKGLTRGQVEQLVLAQQHKAPSAALDKASPTLSRFDTKYKQLVRQLKGDLDTVILKGLKRDPAERYATVDALSQDLQRWQNHEPVRARPDTRWYRTSRFIQRNRLAVSLSGIAVVSLSVGLGIAIWQAQSAQRETRAAVATEAFLTGLFKANSMDQDDPVQAQQTTARVLLERGSERIMGELNNAPETKLRILKTLASLNQDLALDEPGYLLQKKRLEIFRSLHPRQSPALVTELLDTFFAANSSVSGLAGAPDYLQQAEKMLDALGDYSSPQRGRLEVGKAYLLDSDNCAAAKHSQRGVELLRRAPPSEELTDGLLVLTVNLTYCGNSEKALATGQEAINVMKATGRRAKLYYAYAAMADAYSALGKIDLAIQSSRESIAAAQKKLGPHDVPNSNLLAVSSNLAKKLVRAHPRAALDLTQPLTELAMKDVEHCDKDTLVSILIQQALAHELLDQGDAAVKVITQANELLASFDAEDGQRVMLYDAQAEILTTQGMLDRAAQSLAKAAELHAKLHHTGTGQMDFHVLHQVDYQLRRGDAAQAKRDLDGAFLKNKDPKVVSRQRLELAVRRSEVALMRHDWAEALADARETQETAKRFSTPLFVRDLQARAWAVEGHALQALGKPQDAASALKNAAAIHADMLAGVPAI